MADAMRTGVSPRSRIAASTASPLRPGSMRSRTTRSTGSDLEGGERRRPVADDRHRMPVALEVEAQDLGEARFVLDDQDPGAGDHASHRSGAPVKES